MKLRHLRHATFQLQLGAIKLLVDPMLSKKEALDPVRNSANARRNPLVELPVDAAGLKSLISETDAVLLTHTHFDHFDGAAAELLPKALPIICQPADHEKLTKLGFSSVYPVDRVYEWKGISFARTSGKHGRGPTGKAMGQVSGYVLRMEGEPSVYIAGDTIWCADVEKALKLHKPDITVLFAGAAQFLKGGPITMTAEHVSRVCRTVSEADVILYNIIVVHTEAINHCPLTRSKLREHLQAEGISDRVLIPADGECLELHKSNI